MFERLENTFEIEKFDRSGHIVFGLSVCPSVHLSVCLSAKTFTLALGFE